jgi:6-phosphofructokinase
LQGGSGVHCTFFRDSYFHYLLNFRTELNYLQKFNYVFKMSITCVTVLGTDRSIESINQLKQLNKRKGKHAKVYGRFKYFDNDGIITQESY